MNEYKIQKIIGEGTFGKVYRAQHLQTNLEVAIKYIDKQQLNNAQLKERIKQQIQILKQLRHPNIAQLYEIIQDTNNIYLVLQYAKKGDLLNNLKERGKFSEEKTSQLVYQILNAVKYMHSQGVAHRDIKLANIMLSNEDQIKLIDFGLSKKYNAGDKLKTSCGSPCFAAPELIGEQYYKPSKADIWSIGVVTYSLLSGTLPFYHHNLKKLYRIVQKAEFVPLEQRSDEASDFIKSIFIINPFKRISIDAALVHKFILNHKLTIIQSTNQEHNQTSIKDKFIKLIIQLSYNKDPTDYYKSVENNKFDNFHATIELLRSLTVEQLKSICKQFNTINQSTRPGKLTRSSIRSLGQDQQISRFSTVRQRRNSPSLLKRSCLKNQSRKLKRTQPVRQPKLFFSKKELQLHEQHEFPDNNKLLQIKLKEYKQISSTAVLYKYIKSPIQSPNNRNGISEVFSKSIKFAKNTPIRQSLMERSLQDYYQFKNKKSVTKKYQMTEFSEIQSFKQQNLGSSIITTETNHLNINHVQVQNSRKKKHNRANSNLLHNKQYIQTSRDYYNQPCTELKNKKIQSALENSDHKKRLRNFGQVPQRWHLITQNQYKMLQNITAMKISKINPISRNFAKQDLKPKSIVIQLSVKYNVEQFCVQINSKDKQAQSYKLLVKKDIQIPQRYLIKLTPQSNSVVNQIIAAIS